MITLAMRTAIGMENLQLDYPHYDYNTVMTCYTDMDQYESDCKYIEMVIKRAYARELGRVLRVPVIPEFGYPSLDGGPQAAPTANMGFGTSSSGPMNSQAGESIPAGPMGSSPNLAALFHEVFEELHRSDYPRGRWLAYETHLGLLLYGSLVAIKMKRHVEETTPWIKNTQGWREFEDSRANLANNIQFEIRGNHPEQELVRVS